MDLERLLRKLTERIEFLTQGGPAPQIDPRFPAPDSGLLGPLITPSNLTMTVALGASLFDGRFGLASAKPTTSNACRSFQTTLWNLSTATAIS